MISILAILGTLASLAPNEPVTNLSILSAMDRTEVVIAVDGATEVRDFTMEGPARLVLDIHRSRHALPADNFPEIHRGGIRAVRSSQFSDDVVRVVLELDALVGYTLLIGDGFVRLSLENHFGPFEAWSASDLVASPNGFPRALTAGSSAGPVAEPASAVEDIPAVRASRAGQTSDQGFSLMNQVPARRISVSFTTTPIRDVLFTFAEFSDRSIVPGSEVEGFVSADIRDQPWDIALQAVLESQGLAARELESGIIRVDNLENLNQREQVEPLVTRAFRINYATAQDLFPSVEGLVSERGRVTTSQGTNSLVVQDVARVLRSVEDLLAELDVRTPQITISAKIIFVNRTDLNEFGVTYDLKDSQGNQLNVVNPGGVINDEGDFEQVDIGTDIISLGGNSFAALGNARARVVQPSLNFLTSLIIGRHTLINFVEALESVNLSDIQAAPQVSVLDNQQARILVGERTPIRVIDASAGGQQGQQGPPTATVQIEETGIVLEVTPQVTAGDLILMTLHAERSAAELADSDVGLIFRTQEAESRVLVRDGETAVIGGLTVTEVQEVHAGIPLLMNLPYVGRLFRTTRDQRIQRDLMILVTPHINRD
ncbi:MAG: secretin N-terminal domain-containing protein [Gemmatimonadota bacterium]